MLPGTCCVWITKIGIDAQDFYLIGSVVSSERGYSQSSYDLAKWPHYLGVILVLNKYWLFPELICRAGPR